MAAQAPPIENTKPDWLSSAFKVFLFVLPPTLVGQFFPRGHYMLYGVSLIVGALLQALFPPHKYRFWLILGIAFAAAIISPLIFQSIGE
jgi:hypothetical protein